MPRTAKASPIVTPSQRARLPDRAAPWWRPIRPGLRLGYRRPAPGAGAWVACLALTGTGQVVKMRMAAADDGAATADGVAVMTFAQAMEAAQTWARAPGKGVTQTAATVKEALTLYRKAKQNSGQSNRASEVGTVLKTYLGPLASKPVIGLRIDDLRGWQNTLPGSLTQDRRDKLRGVVGAALRFVNADTEVLRAGLKATSTRTQPAARRAVLDRATINLIHEHSSRVAGDDFALFLRACDETGARPGQLTQCTLADLDTRNAILHVPSSRKGKPGTSKQASSPVPITTDLASALKNNVDRTTGLILHMPRNEKRMGATIGWETTGRTAWQKMAWARAMRAVVEAAEVDRDVTIYALRHSRVVEMLLDRIPPRLIAATLDTSTAMIERHYSRWIVDGTGAMDAMRAVLNKRG